MENSKAPVKRLYVNPDIHRQLKAVASLQGKSLQTVVEEVFNDWLSVYAFCAPD